ncbi:MAG: FMN reductase [Ahrensia sp.]|nr:FMN reductase [Ahrensia sp.]|tara:strand:+ start:31232 stop:31828 length:597 start_codon:yes stop_codon:yes gene_type:complete
MTDRPKLGVIVSSAREGRFADRVLAWTLKGLAADGRFDPEIIDPREYRVTLWHGDMQADDMSRLKATLDACAAFIVIAAEYNHSYPAAVKSLIDAGKTEWEAKPVAFVSYGGVSGGLRSVEALRLVFAELHAVTLRDTVSMAMPFQRMNENGELADGEMADRALALVLNRLEWWTSALSAARAATPYSLSAGGRSARG